jgi:type II secretory pathway component GspD/PulD (secretin)
MDAIALVSRCFWTAKNWGEVMVASDTSKNHKEFEHYVLRTYYLPDINSPQELTDIVNALRTLFEIRFVQAAPANNSITVRGPAPVVEAATRFLQSLWSGKPQVMIDLEVFAVNHQMMRNMGVSLPLQFSAFNIPEAALAALSNTNIQQLISQLITSGGLNSANAASSIAALIAQIQQQQNSLFQNPVATFGGGKTLTGVGIPPTTLNFSYSDSRVTSLEKLSLHAAQGNAATFRVGTRYPVMNASYSNAVNIPSQIASLLGPTGAGLGQSNALLAYPSFSYEDLGITLKAKPAIHGANDVTLDLELEMRALAGGSVNGVPILSNQSYKGIVTVMDGESAVIAGEITQSEMQSLQGIPGIHNLPVLGTLTSNRTKQTDDEELLLVITPHIMSMGAARSGPSIAVPNNSQ